MKNNILLTCSLFLALTLAPTIEAAGVEIRVEDESCPFFPSPRMEDGRIMVPLRATFEALGVLIEWDKESQTATGYHGDKTIQISMGSKQALVAGNPVVIDIPATIYDGISYVPLRFAFEVLGCTVEWDEETKVVQIYLQESPQKAEEMVSTLQEYRNLYGYRESPRYVFYQQGIASWYGSDFHGTATASGEIFNKHDFTAAHRELPFGTKVKVTFLKTGKSALVRINDYGPHIGSRVIDLSRAAADAIGLVSYGLGEVRLEVVQET